MDTTNLEKKIETLQFCLNDLVAYFSISLNDGNNYDEFRSLMGKYLDFNKSHMNNLEDENNEDFLKEYHQFEDEYAEMVMSSVGKKGGRKNNKTRKIRKKK